MKVSTEIDNNFGYEKITQLVDNIPLTKCYTFQLFRILQICNFLLITYDSHTLQACMGVVDDSLVKTSSRPGIFW
jgi:hypothetical protein